MVLPVRDLANFGFNFFENLKMVLLVRESGDYGLGFYELLKMRLLVREISICESRKFENLPWLTPPEITGSTKLKTSKLSSTSCWLLQPLLYLLVASA